MNAETAHQLLELNRQFYQTFAGAFDATRQRLQPGVLRLIERFPPGGRVLDLGCGNGRLARELALQGRLGFYLGVDFTLELLDAARSDRAVAQSDLADDVAGDHHAESRPPESGKTNAAGFQAASLRGAGSWKPRVPAPVFLQFDLSAADWRPLHAHAPFDLIVAFAVLHHLPSEALRRQVLEQVRRLLPSGGRFIHSEWQFLRSARLRERIQPWERLGLSPERVDRDDYLLDWRSGGEGLRYVHYFSEAELADLARKSGFKIQDTFYADGTDGQLSIYQIWMAL